MKKPESICVFGDSTAWGAWDLEKGGWVGRLWLHVAKRDKDYVEIYNLSISGGTTQTILDRFEDESKIREADALIFQSGGNDSYLQGRGGPNNIPKEKFRKNVEEIIERAKKITDKIIFIGFKNVDESRTMPVSWKDIYYMNAELEQYGQIIEEVCENNDVLYLDIFGLLQNDDLDDGIHPNASGHQKIFEQVKSFLAQNNWI